MSIIMATDRFFCFSLNMVHADAVLPQQAQLIFNSEFGRSAKPHTNNAS
jgi:hypothetical protein